MMNGWKEVRFGDITDLIKRGIAPKYVEEGGYIVINQKCIRDGVLSFGDSRLTSKEKKVANEKFVQVGDVLINSTGTGTLGRTAPVRKLPGTATVDTHVTILRGNNKVDKLFLGYLASHYEPLITLLGKGATNQIELGASDLRVTKVVIPESKETQRKIAAILSAYDDLIENNLKRIKLLEEKAQLTYEEWFMLRKLNGEIIIDSQINIEQLSENIERFINGGWGKEEIEGNYFNEAYVIRGTDMPKVSKGQFDDLPLRYHTESNLKSRLLQHGDIAIEMSNGNIGNVGRSFYFDSGLSKILSKPTICASFCKMIRPKTLNLSYLIDAHLKYIYNTNKMLVYKAQAANGINNFNFDEMIKDEELFIPKGEKLDILTDSIRLNYDAISNIRIQNQHLKEARDILLPRLMTGMIDVEQMNIETLQPTTA